MTEKRSGRPPVAPKPSFIQQNAASSIPSPLSSPALRGATSAYGPGPGPLKTANASASSNPSAGALAAAAAVGKKQLAQSVNNNAPSRELSVPAGPRGRALTAERVPATGTSLPSSISPHKPNFLPHTARSTSAVAAVAASTRTSPARPELKKDKTGSYQTKVEYLMETRRRGMSTSSNGDNQQAQVKSQDALAGAVASMATVASQIAAQRTGGSQKQDLAASPNFTLQSPQHTAVSSPSSSGTAAAAMATRNAAAFELAKRTFSPPSEQVRSRATSRDVNLSATTSMPWPNVKVTPPQTDSESDLGRSAPELHHKTLPAPVPLRPARAAMVAQEQANLNSRTQAAALNSQNNMTVNALADAMVAGSIASSHAPSRVHSPAVKPPPPKPRRRSKSVGLFDGGRHRKNSHGLGGSETPKLDPPPVRPMRHTLRKTSPEQEDKYEEQPKRGRRHWRRHPNMHHEGDRKRWRDKVTERERKRYEGVWAANRGVLVDYDLEYLDSEFAGDLVINVVAKDIWERSRLPGDVLEEIWDLVASPEAKALNREEFVVGLWLIDQRLKGRKMPVKVSTSVWSSVRHTLGVRISSKPIPK